MKNQATDRTDKAYYASSLGTSAQVAVSPTGDEPQGVSASYRHAPKPETALVLEPCLLCASVSVGNRSWSCPHSSLDLRQGLLHQTRAIARRCGCVAARIWLKSGPLPVPLKQNPDYIHSACVTFVDPCIRPWRDPTYITCLGLCRMPEAATYMHESADTGHASNGTCF